MEENKDVKNEKDLKEKIYLKIKSIHEYFINKKNNTEKANLYSKKENDNFYIKYLNNNNIIFQDKGDINNTNLKLLFSEINKDIDNENNILFPFLDVSQNLVKAYVESDLDDINVEKEESIPPTSKSIYLKTIEKLKNNCFINKNILYPIYDYFSNIYDMISNKKELKIDNVTFKKYHKLINLYEMFYDTDINKRNGSNFCFIGGNMNIVFDQVIQADQAQIFIKISINNRIFMEYINSNSNLLKINDKTIKYKEIQKFKIIEEIKEINIIFKNDEAKKINLDIENKSVNIIMKVQKDFKEILLFEDFFGQISSINISIMFKNNGILEYEFLPTSIRNENTIYYMKKIIKQEEEIPIDITPTIILNDLNLVNINYLNYNAETFNIVDYFGGIIQFLPFHIIVKRIHQIGMSRNEEIDNNESLMEINQLSYNIFDNLNNNFINFIFKIVLNKLLLSEKKEKLFKKYAYFIFYLSLDLDMDLSIDSNDFEKEQKIFNSLEMLKMIYYNQKNQSCTILKEELGQFIISSNYKNTIFKKPKKRLNQLYNEYMKQLFCFNNYWSKRKIFYPKRYNIKNDVLEKDIKYKQINYYTKNYQLPFFYPILEYKKYYPRFQYFKGKLYKENKNNILEYNFKLDKNKKAEIVLSLMTFENENNKANYEPCCLVKNTHHAFGVISIINKQNNKNNFNIIFNAMKNGNENMKCNKKDQNDNESESKKNKNNEKKIVIDQEIIPSYHENLNDVSISPDKLCYGSTFPCPERDYAKNIIIKSKDILFILIRIYFHRVSAIEIFTINKSYYFNFQEYFQINNIKTNIILNKIKSNSCFKEIKLKNEKIVIGYYNIKYKSYLYPLFEDEMNIWDNKVNYFCNYDKIILINLLSNRSFKDICQYPIFPIFYNLIGIKRNMAEPIGFQNDDKSKTKWKIFLDNYKLNERDRDEGFLFDFHYSNPVFICNYLLRVIPYSFLSIEFQGNNFDEPGRLFFSVEYILNNTMTNKSDLREMIPEFYYMIELFYNKNNFSFGKLSNKRTIDNVLIKEDDNFESELKRKENFGRFLYSMRKYLEEEKEINKWIDLIFGINQKYYSLNENTKYKYYEQDSEINYKNEHSILNDTLIMEKVTFGLLPYQIFDIKFPAVDIDKEKKEIIFQELKELNIELFKDEHIKINSPLQTFLCKGNILIDNNYIKIINPNCKINKMNSYYNINVNNIKGNANKINNKLYDKIFGHLDIEKYTINEKYQGNINLVNYYFVGNVFGTVFIFALKELNKSEHKEEQKTEKEKEKQYYNSIMNTKFIEINFKLEIALINRLYNHSKEIKYIDFNSRLNILLSYALDNFINIYIFPKLKLINVIDTISFKDTNDKNYFDEVVLLSYPFPSIVCHNKEYLYYLSINGELIKYEKLSEGDTIVFSIDKNSGISRDTVEIYHENHLKKIFNFFDEEKVKK